MNAADPDASWRRTFAAMASVQFILAAAFSIVPPVIPLLLPQIGVVDLDEIGIWSGLVLGVTPLTAGIMAPVWGRLVDKLDRRNVIFVACAAAAICTLLMSIAATPAQLLMLRFAMGFFGGHIVAVLAFVTGVCPPSRVGWALGWLSTAQLAGMLLGPLIGGSIADALDSYRAPFVAGGCASALVAMAVLRLPKQIPFVSGESRRSPGIAEVLRRYPDLYTAVLVLLLAQLAITSAQPIVSLFVHSLVGPVDNLATLAGIAFSVVGVSGLIAAPHVGRAGDRIGEQRLLILVLGGAALFTLMQGFSATYLSFVTERFVAGLFLAGVIPLANALVAHRVAAEHRGRAFGLTGSATFLGAFLGPLSGGIITAHFGLARVFEVASLALLLAALVVYAAKRRSSRTG